ncbi:unnamed protein product [Ranitomeya imitator]|uniref:Gem-associated protein 2 n=1 Tax=Ranitomeya imitator TaxID=111125 RepID=A0ABN9LBR8_9NEOB|nr:unnamed protein product [Ranitomeya imitator]
MKLEADPTSVEMPQDTEMMLSTTLRWHKHQFHTVIFGGQLYFASWSNLTDSQAILECLKNHHLYEIAEKCVVQRFPELVCSSEKVNAWALFAVIVLLSTKVDDIQRLIRCLRHSRSPLPLIEVMEALYCLATCLFAMREQKIGISNSRRHNMYCKKRIFSAEKTQQTPACKDSLPKENLGPFPG